MLNTEEVDGPGPSSGPTPAVQKQQQAHVFLIAPFIFSAPLLLLQSGAQVLYLVCRHPAGNETHYGLIIAVWACVRSRSRGWGEGELLLMPGHPHRAARLQISAAVHGRRSLIFIRGTSGSKEVFQGKRGQIQQTGSLDPAEADCCSEFSLNNTAETL